jgi:hypothetical protein
MCWLSNDPGGFPPKARPTLRRGRGLTLSGLVAAAPLFLAGCQWPERFASTFAQEVAQQLRGSASDDEPETDPAKDSVGDDLIPDPQPWAGFWKEILAAGGGLTAMLIIALKVYRRWRVTHPRAQPPPEVRL